MKKFVTAVTILATLTTGLTQADIFDFSYTFTSTDDGLTPSYPGGDILTGSFTGLLNQSTNLISNISNIQVSIDGVAFSSPLIVVGWNSATASFADTIAPAVSPTEALNNFAFADVDLAVNQQWNKGLVFVNDPNQGGQTIWAFNASIQDSSGGQLNVSDTPVNASWKVVDVSSASVSVPIPFAAEMILAAGLGLLSKVVRRR